LKALLKIIKKYWNLRIRNDEKRKEERSTVLEICIVNSERGESGRSLHSLRAG